MADSPESKMRNPDRILVLSLIDGKAPKSSTGMIDPRLFTGENKLHAKMDVTTNFWYFQYDSGILPEPLKQRFTSFKMLLKHAEDYFKTRNLEIKQVIS
jgi:hypothetical protein